MVGRRAGVGRGLCWVSALLFGAACAGTLPPGEAIWWVQGDGVCPAGSRIDVSYPGTAAWCTRTSDGVSHGLVVTSESAGTFTVGANRDGEPVGLWRTYEYPEAEMRARFDAHVAGELAGFEPDEAHQVSVHDYGGDPP